MTGALPNALWPDFSECVAAQTGLYFPTERWPDLQRGLAAAARELGFPDADSCMRGLLASPVTKHQIRILASHLTVGETYFFRQRECFELLEKRILPELIGSRRGAGQRLRIWSAGCCTGEEPYSVAILLRQILPDWKEWNLTLLGTDIHPERLRTASQGLYHEWSFREMEAAIKEKYFTRRDARSLEILPALRDMVRFSYLNLAQDAYPSPESGIHSMDVILCRNVLMYFAPGRASEVVRKLHGCLVDGGWLIVGPSETSEVMFSEFATVNLPGITVYRKENRATQGTALSLPASDSDIFLPAADADSPLDGRGPGAEPGPCHAANQSVVPSAFRDELSASEESAPDPSEEGLRLCHQGRYGEAVDVLVAWLSQRPGDAQAMTLLARAYANQGRLADALEWCTRVIAADKLNPAVHYLAATIFQEQGRLPEAVASLQRAIYLDPDFTLAHVALGNLRQRQGRGPESRRHFENALRTLSHRSQEETVPESGGITTGRLTEIIQSASCFALGE